VSQIVGIYQKNIFEICALYHIMPFAKTIGLVKMDNFNSSKDPKNFHKTPFKAHKWKI
jgi:hypothetical protein